MRPVVLDKEGDELPIERTCTKQHYSPGVDYDIQVMLPLDGLERSRELAMRASKIEDVYWIHVRSQLDLSIRPYRF